MTEAAWEATWHTPNDTVLLHYQGYLSGEHLQASLDRVLEMVNHAEGDLKIYAIVDQSDITDFDPTLNAIAMLHEVFVHPRAGKLYLVGNGRALQFMSEAFNVFRPDSVRLADNIAAATHDIAKLRADLNTLREETNLVNPSAQPTNKEESEDSTAGGWEASWYFPNDTLLVRYYGFMSDEIMVEALDELTRKFEEATGDLRIYTIADQREVTGYSPTVNITAALHHGFFHPRAGKLYIVRPQSDELETLGETLNSRRNDSVRFAPTIEAAAADIRQRRALYFARKGNS